MKTITSLKLVILYYKTLWIFFLVTPLQNPTIFVQCKFDHSICRPKNTSIHLYFYAALIE